MGQKNATPTIPNTVYGINQVSLYTVNSSKPAKKNLMSKDKEIRRAAAQLNANLSAPSRVNGEQISKKEEFLLREAE